MEQYDVIIIGGGPAGYSAAFEGAKRKLSIALIEESKIGGVCLHEGCIPMKSMLHSAKVFYDYKMKYSSGIQFEYILINKEKEDSQKSLEKSLIGMLKDKYIVCFQGNAQILERDRTGNFQIRISDEETIYGKNLIIATGSISIEIKDLINETEKQNLYVMSSSEFIKEPFCEGHTLVVGAGAVGLEIADFIIMSGNSVTVIDEKEVILQEFDNSIRSSYLYELGRKGIDFDLGTRIHQVNQQNKTVVLKKCNSGEHTKREFDRIVVAIGRKARIPKGLDKIGVEYHNSNGILTDTRCKTNISNCYACGDVNDKPMLAHIAFEEGRKAISDIVDVDIDQEINYHNMPHIIYTTPELAKTGLDDLSQEVCFQASSAMAYGSKYFIENRKEHGLIKLYLNKREIIVGAQVMGTGASELIVFLEAAIDKKMTMNEIKSFNYPHPSIAEAVKYVTIVN